MSRHLLFCSLIALVSTAVVTAAAPAPAAAQAADCRCVDANGETIDDCTCFRTPRFELGLYDLLRDTASRPRLGVTLVPDADGARITFVNPGSGAENARLQVGDVIVSVAGRSLLERLGDEDQADDAVVRIQNLAAEWEHGDEVVVTVLRSGEERDFAVRVGPPNWGALSEQINLGVLSPRFHYLDSLRTSGYLDSLGDRVETSLAKAKALATRAGSDSLRLGRVLPLPPLSVSAPTMYASVLRARTEIGGVELTDMRSGLASYFGTEEGVLVLGVDDGSTLGLEAGDVILRIGDREASDANRVVRILRSYERGEEIRMDIVREGREIEVMGTLSRRR